MKLGNQIRRICMVMLCLMMVFIVSGFASVPTALADGVTVTIKSFMRGVSADGTIRNSELMEAVLEGYEGNPNELTYEWTNVSCSADLYLFNSYNMSGIDNTPGEIEKIEKNHSDGGKGFAWASMRSKDANNNYNGEIRVVVKDAKGKEIARDTYKTFAKPDLQQDMNGIAFGMFIGERVNVKDLLGRSAIVHITCQGSSVSEGQIADPGIAKLEQVTEGWNSKNYYVTGISKGQTMATIKVTKSSCSFHTNQSATVTTPIYVFEKPKTSTTTTTLTLTELDENCDYFIGSMQGVKTDDGQVVFTGLTPNTEYQVTVRGKYTDGNTVKYAYAYVKDTTKPVYTATVRTYLDNVLMDIDDIHHDTSLYLKKDNTNDYIPLTRTNTGVYTAGVENGTYHVYHLVNNEYKQANNALLQINGRGAELDLRHYSVTYNCNGGSFADGENTSKKIYFSGDKVSVVDEVPAYEGHSFIGWSYNNKTYQPGTVLTNAISSPMTLTAQWQKAVTVTINVTIDHQGGDGYDQIEDKADLDVYLLEKRSTDAAPLETGDALHFSPAKVTNENGGVMSYNHSATYLPDDTQTPDHALTTTYTATAATYVNRSGSSDFDVKVQKSHYDVDKVEIKQDNNGNWTIDIHLEFTPSNFDLQFSVHMANNVPKELYPDAVIYKVAFWATDRNQWEIITQMEGDKGGARVDIDPSTGKGSGSYPVWKYEDGTTPYGYRVVVTGFVYDDHTITVPTQKNVGTVYSDGNYTATMSDVTDGKLFGASLNGSYIDGNTQKGTLDAEITVEAYNVIFNAMGGTVNGKSTQTVENQYYIPAFSGYHPINGEHNFLGWYMDEDYTTPAVENELLTHDVELYARWDRVLTGSAIVEGYYEQDDETVDVWERDRVERVNVILQQISGNNTQSIASQTVNVTWNEENKTGKTDDYKFTGLSPDKTYRVVFDVVNYTAAYQNANTASGKYNATDYTAVYKDGAISTFVNGHLDFTPASYNQPVEVDATRIGEGFRPDEVLAVIDYRETSSGDEWKVISQHTVSPFGIEMSMDTNGLPAQAYSESVWKSVWDGALYDYQVKVTKLNTDAPDTWPVHIIYGSVARWSPLHSAPTGTLTATLVPNEYDVIYHLNDGTDNTEIDAHTWSFETKVDYAPSREGYNFGGWYTDADCTGTAVTTIAADTHENTNLYAKWTARSDLKLMVKHVNKQTDALIDDEIKTVTFGETHTGEELKKDFEGYTYVNSNPESVTIQLDKNEITLYYNKNSYSYTVRYLEQDTNAVLRDEKQGSGTFNQTITENAEEIPGYNVDSSTKDVKLDVDNKVLTFWYTKRSDLTLTVYYKDADTNEAIHPETIVNNLTLGDEVNLDPLTLPITGYKSVHANPESVTVLAENNVLTLYYEKTDIQYTVRYYYDGVEDVDAAATLNAKFKSTVDSYTDKKIDGYALDVVENFPLTIGADPTKNVIKVYYATDKLDDKDDNETDGDGIPDKYQALVTFKVINGTWTSGGTGTQTKRVYTLEEAVNGVWTVVEPAPVLGELPVAKPDKTHDANSGEWDVVIDSSTLVTKNETYTYIYNTENQYTITYNVVNGTAATNNTTATSGSVTVTYGDDLALTFQPNDGYALDSVTVDNSVAVLTDVNGTTGYKFTDVKGNHHIEVVYAEDQYRDGDKTTDTSDTDSETGGDNIPDKYQALVTYTIENGTWSDGQAAPIKAVFTLKTYNTTNGKWDDVSDVTLGNTVPTDMKPVTGYDSETGGWDTTPMDTTPVTGNATYHYTYGGKVQVTITIEVGNGTSSPAASTTTFDYDAAMQTTITFTPNAEHILESVTVNGEAGALVNGTYTHGYTEDLHIKVVYTLDTIGGGDDGEDPDGIPDKYQKKITFKVDNGTWEDGTTADIIEVVTLMKDGEWAEDGTATVVAPTDMKPTEGYKDSGAWDADIPDRVSGTDPLTFTYTFLRSITPLDPLTSVRYIVNHYKGDANDTYPTDPTDQEVLPGQVGTTVYGVEKDYEGYVLNTERSQTSGELKPIRSAEDIVILNLYYNLKTHTVKYDLAGGNPATGVNYSDQTYRYGETAQVLPVPMYHGHTFKGWQDQNGTPRQFGSLFTVDSDYTITAIWEKQSGLSYQVNYLNEDANNATIVPTKVVEGKTYLDKVTSASEVIEISGYTFVRADKDELTIDATVSNNVINLYYAVDNFRDSDETTDTTDKDSETGGDNIPDKYQKKIVFKVVNGTWADDTTADIIEIATLKKDGQPAKDGTATLTAPTGMKPADGFKEQSGVWDADIPNQVSGTASLTFTYSYDLGNTPIKPLDSVSYIVEHYKANENDVYPTEPTDKEILAGKIGTTVTGVAKVYEGYCLNSQVSITSGMLKKIEGPNDIVVLKLYYNKDVIGGGDNGDQPDNIPDMYQKKIVFKVVNGTWADGSVTDIIEIITLKKDGKWDVTGTAPLTAPTGMIANTGFVQESGAWDADIPEQVFGTDTLTFTYTFLHSTTPITPSTSVYYVVEHFKANDDRSYPMVPTDREILFGQIGSVVTAVPKTYPGYYLNTEISTMSATLKSIVQEGDIVFLKLYYDKVVIPEIPAVYHKKVIFKVENGTWADGTTQDIIVYVTLMKAGKSDPTGTATLTAPTGMKPFPNFTDGQWDVIPPTTVSGLQDEVYTYFYLPEVIVPPTGDTMVPELWFTLMSGSFLLLALLAIRRKARTWNI